MSPTQRTLKALRDEGGKCAVVERWLPYAGKFGKRQDLFGIIDVLVLTPKGVVGVQCCGGSFAAHYKKIIEEKRQETYDWLTIAPNCFLQIWSWCKVKKKRGGKAMVWKPRIVEITLEDLDI